MAAQIIASQCKCSMCGQFLPKNRFAHSVSWVERGDVAIRIVRCAACAEKQAQELIRRYAA